MTFNGIPLGQLLTVGGIAAALVVVFYILKLRRRPIPVPFSPIWQRFLRDKEATSLFSQLKRLLSLLVQLVLLALLLFALGDPRTAKNMIEGRNVVVLIDASASMQATDVSPSRLDEGKAEVRDMIRGLGGSDRMLLAEMDATVTPLTTLTGDIPELEAGLAAVKARDAHADFARALRFAADTLRGTHNPEIIVVSDGILDEPRDAAGLVDLGDIKLSYVPVGKGGKNVAITEFTVRRYPLDKSRYEVMLELTNTSDVEQNVELSLYGDGLVTDVQKVILKPHEPLKRFYPNLSGASRTLEARLRLADGTSDDLPADDRAYALLPERKRARIQVVSAGNLYLDAALFLNEYLDVTTIPPDQYPAPGEFDVTIFDSVAPAVAPKSGSILYLNPPKNSNEPFEVGDEIVAPADAPFGFDTLEAEHPLIKHAHFNDINISRIHPLKPPKEDKIVGASFKGPLLVAGRHDGAKYVALGFDISESDLPLRIAWPLFVLNTINDFVEEDASYISSFVTGNVWRIPAPSNVDAAMLVDPDGDKRSVPVDQGRAVFLGQEAGVYTLETGAEGGVEQSMFAANLVDTAESSIDPKTSAILEHSDETGRDELVVGSKMSGPPSKFTVGVRREIWIYLLFAALVISAVEWLTYHRRVTV
jgi:hypothetical protein